MEGKTILLVEDNPDHQELTRRALAAAEIFQFTVVLGDGQEALDFMFGHGAWSQKDARRLPALVLLDLKLGALDGLDVLRKIRANAKTSRVPVVVLTSSKEDRDVSRAYEAGASGYIRKSLNFDDFSEDLKLAAKYWLDVNVPAP